MEDRPNQHSEQAQKRKAVLELAIQGFKPAEILAKTGIPYKEVVEICRDAYAKAKINQSRKEVMEEIFKNKVPALEGIVGLTLSILQECLEELADPLVRKEMIKNVRDMKTMSEILTNVNTFLRLELGQSTQNIGVESRNISYQETRVVLQELSKIDPVFEYPKLPESEKDNEKLPF